MTRKTIILLPSILLFVNTLLAQKNYFTFNFGINKSLLVLENNKNPDFDKKNILDFTSFDFDKTWSFEKEFDKKSVFNFLRFFDYGLSYNWSIKDRHYLGFRIEGGERNYRFVEYPLDYLTRKKFKVPANRMRFSIPIISNSIMYTFDLKPNIKIKSGFSIHKYFFNYNDNIFFQSNVNQRFLSTINFETEIRLHKNVWFYARYNKGLYKYSRDDINLFSATAYLYPEYKINVANRGTSLQIGVLYNIYKKVDENESINFNKNIVMNNCTNLKKVKTFKIQHLTVDTNEIEICFYDSMRNDGDIIQIYSYCDSFLQEITTSATPECEVLKIDGNQTEINIISKSEGDLPTNTSTIIIKCGNKIYNESRIRIDDKNGYKLIIHYEKK